MRDASPLRSIVLRRYVMQSEKLILRSRSAEWHLFDREDTPPGRAVPSKTEQIPH
jgi:hypothetical protein